MLVTCSECGGKLSHTAQCCRHCGFSGDGSGALDPHAGLDSTEIVGSIGSANRAFKEGRTLTSSRPERGSWNFSACIECFKCRKETMIVSLELRCKMTDPITGNKREKYLSVTGECSPCGISFWFINAGSEISVG